MATFLTIVTVAYAVILVLVLAVSLITIAVLLWRVGTTLGQIAGGLQVVRQQTAPLGQHVDALNGSLAAVSEGLQSAAGHLAAADERIGAAMGEPSTPAKVA